MTPSHTPTGRSGRPAMPEGWARIMTVLLVPLFLSLMSVSTVNVALPAIEEGLGATSADLQWVLAGYTLAFGVVLVAAGRAGDLWGRKTFFITGILVFTLGALASGLAVSPLMLNLARLLTGIGSGLLNPQIIGIIQSVFHGPARGRAYGMFGTVIGLGVAVGPLMGGIVIQTFGPEWGWRWTFLINVPIGLFAAFMAWRWLRSPVRDQSAQVTPRSLTALDPVGALLLAAGVVGLMLPFMVRGTWYLMGAAVVVLAVWWWWESRLARSADPAHQPMVDPRLFRIPSFTFGTLEAGAFLATMPGVWAVQAIFTQQGLGLSPLAAGLTTLPSAVLVAVLSPIVGSKVHRYGPVFVVIGAGFSIVSLVLAAVSFHRISTGDWPYWTLAASLGLLGVVQAFLLTSTQVITMHDVPAQSAGAAGGISQTAQRVLTAVGLAAVTGAYFAALSPEAAPGITPPVPEDTALAHGQAAGVAMVVVGAFWGVMAVLAVIDLVRRHRGGSLSLTGPGAR